MKRLLMLDFDRHLLSAVTRALQHKGVEVVSAGSVERARELVRDQSFDAALLDGDLLGAGELPTFAALPVILTTSFLEPEGGHLFFRHARLLRKPFTSAQLLTALREVCGAPNGENTSLLDVLRRAHGAGATLALRVGEAQLFIERGELVHVELNGSSGERALAELLAEATPAEPAPIAARAPRRSIQRPFQALMLDVLRHLEECEERESELARDQLDSSPPGAKGPRS
jgi:DNA-binding response OmpR family regulator